MCCRPSSAPPEALGLFGDLRLMGIARTVHRQPFAQRHRAGTGDEPAGPPAARRDRPTRRRPCPSPADVGDQSVVGSEHRRAQRVAALRSIPAAALTEFVRRNEVVAVTAAIHRRVGVGMFNRTTVGITNWYRSAARQLNARTRAPMRIGGAASHIAQARFPEPSLPCSRGNAVIDLTQSRMIASSASRAYKAASLDARLLRYCAPIGCPSTPVAGASVVVALAETDQHENTTTKRKAPRPFTAGHHAEPLAADRHETAQPQHQPTVSRRSPIAWYDGSSMPPRAARHAPGADQHNTAAVFRWR